MIRCTLSLLFCYTFRCSTCDEATRQGLDLRLNVASRSSYVFHAQMCLQKQCSIQQVFGRFSSCNLIYDRLGLLTILPKIILDDSSVRMTYLDRISMQLDNTYSLGVSLYRGPLKMLHESLLRVLAVRSECQSPDSRRLWRVLVYIVCQDNS